MIQSVKFVSLLALVGSALARPDGTGGHHEHGHHGDHGAVAAPAPASGYAEPVASYAEPAYSAPASGYGAPDTGYGAPDAGYSDPNSGYGAPATGYGTYDTAPAYEEQTGGFDLSALLIPILIITGLALLFPSTTVVPVNGPGRRKRDADEVEGPTMATRMLDIMQSVATSEQCMERIACEIGGMADKAGMDKTMSKIAEGFVSKKAQKLMKKFNGSEDCRKIKCGVF